MLFNRKSALHSTKVEMPTNKTKLNCILGVVGGASGAHDALLKRRFLNECASRRKQREFLFGKSCFLPMNFGPKNNNCCRRQFMPAWWGKSGFLLIKCLSMIYIDCICMTVTRNSFGQKKKKLKTKPSTKQQTQQELSTFASTFRHAQKQTFTEVRSPYSVAPSFPEVSRWGNWKSKILNLLALHVVLAGKVSIEGGLHVTFELT